MRLQYGDIILVHGTDFMSYAIEYLTRSYWSHTMLVLEDGKFAQMDAFGFRLKPQTLDRTHIVLRHQELLHPSFPNAQRIVSRMKQVVAEIDADPPRFDYRTFFRLGFKLIGERMTASISVEEIGPFVCSALVDYIYEQSGIDLRPGQDPGDTTPANLEALAFGDQPVFRVVYDSRKRNN